MYSGRRNFSPVTFPYYTHICAFAIYYLRETYFQKHLMGMSLLITYLYLIVIFDDYFETLCNYQGGNLGKFS